MSDKPLKMTDAALAAETFEAWTLEPLESLSNKRFLDAAVILRLCYTTMGRTKYQLVQSLSDKEGRRCLSRLQGSANEAEEFFNAMASICAAASGRLMVSEAAAKVAKKTKKKTAKRRARK